MCLGGGTGLGLLVVELRARRAQDDKTAAVVRENVASGSEQLPQLGSVGIGDVHVHRALEHIDYVRRDVEPEVERRLRTKRRVLIVGPSMSGKTRLALQLIRQLYADHWLLVPKDGKALHGLLAAGVTGTRMVVWLDDLERYLSTDGVSTDVLDRFHVQGNVLVATIRSAAYEALLPVGELRPAGWEVPGWFGDPVWLIRWTEADLDRAAAAGIPARVLAGARRHGLSAYLGGGPLALDRLRAAETTHPIGHALVRAAADWRRVGVSSPVQQPVLVALAPVYLDTRAGRPQVDEETVRQGLKWVTILIDDTVALLEQANGGYSVLDYALDFFTSQRSPIPQQAWDATLEHADPGDLVSVGYQAATEHDRFDVAETAWRRGAAHDLPGAMSNLGVLLEKQGDVDGARHAWQQAIDTSDPDAAPMAAINQGNLLVDQGDVAGVRIAYQQALDSGHPRLSAEAAAALAELLNIPRISKGGSVPCTQHQTEAREESEVLGRCNRLSMVREEPRSWWPRWRRWLLFMAIAVGTAVTIWFVPVLFYNSSSWSWLVWLLLSLGIAAGLLACCY